MKIFSKKTHDSKARRFGRPFLAFAAYLLAATLLTTGITYAVYTSSGTGSDTAAVAKWDVQASVTAPETAKLTVGSDETVTCTITFANTDTQVNVNYRVEVAGLPSEVTAVLTQKDSAEPIASTTGDDGVVTFALGMLSKGSSVEYTLTIKAGRKAASGVDVSVTAIAEQAV